MTPQPYWLFEKCLPLVLFLLMGGRYFGAIPFVVATVIVCIAALAILAAAFWPKKPSAA